jgi:hypothetical protein
LDHCELHHREEVDGDFLDGNFFRSSGGNAASPYSRPVDAPQIPVDRPPGVEPDVQGFQDAIICT